MQITTHEWKELDLHEVARLTCAAKGSGGQTSAEAVERMVERLDDHMAALPRYAVLARVGEQLVGWLMLVAQNPAKVEVNSWFLGGHPLVAPGQDRQAVGAPLLKQAIAWARQGGFEAVELGIERDLGADPQVYEAFNAWYASLGFGVREESLGFFRRLSSPELPAPVAPGDVELVAVTDVDQDELYDCYHAALADSQSGYFLDQGERERRAYFDTLGKTYGQHEGTSLALLQKGRIVGFSYTAPFGEHLFLDWIGIHPDVRRRGLGRFLLLTVMERAACDGFRSMGLGCNARNVRAIALYRGLGWEDGGDAEIKYAARL
ncbi:MAG: GNAT family N-acetyltransferase [Anaerolineae bacterium]|jgi:ribosomal protein S18 acetylase RimI-like enzyme